MSWGRLLLRHLRLSGTRWAALALVVALTSALAMAWPRWLATTTTDELHRELSGSSRFLVDPSAAPKWLPLFGDAAAAWRDVTDAMAGERAALPEPLRGVLGDPQGWATFGPLRADSSSADLGAAMYLEPASAPGLMDHARIVEGRAPAAVPGQEPMLEIALSTDSAREMGWSVGEFRTTPTTLPDSRPGDLSLALVGVFEPDDPASDYWQNSPTLLRPTVVRGDTWTVNGRGLVSESALELLTYSSLAQSQMAVRLWLPFDTAAVDVAEASLLADQLHAELASVDAGFTSMEFTSTAAEHIDSVLGRSRAAQAVLGLAVAAPAGVLLALLALAAQVVVAPRRGATLLMALRGASVGQHRALLTTEAALVTLPAAALGGGLAASALPGYAAPSWWLAPAALALAPVLALAADSPTPRTPWVPRVAVEVGIGVLAVAALATLAAQGTADSAGTDLLAVVAPLLLAVAVALVCARVMPAVLRPAARRLHRRDDLVAPLGSALAARRPVPLTATVATVAGTAVALLGVLVTSTIDAARETAALSEIGADVRVLGSLGDGHVAELRAIPGVEGAATVATSTSVPLVVDGESVLGTLYVVDGDLDHVQRDVAGRVPVPGPGEVVVGRAAPVSPGDAGELKLLPRIPVTVSGTAEGIPGVTHASIWKLVDRSTLADTSLRLDVRIVLLTLSSGADRDAVVAAVAEVVGPNATIDVTAHRLEALRAAPTAAAMSTGILVVVVAGLLAAVAAVVLALSARSASRTRVVAVLRTMGLPPRAEGRLVLWETAPGVAVGLAAGAVLGFALTWLLLATVDVRPFTGGEGRPPFVVDPATLVAALAAVVAVAGAAVVASAWAAARRSAAVVLRAGEERT